MLVSEVSTEAFDTGSVTFLVYFNFSLEFDENRSPLLIRFKDT